MKRVLVALSLGLMFLAGCSSTPSGDSAKSVTLDYPAAAVQKAAIEALTTNGCDIQKSDAGYVEGFRSHKAGLMVGSGGETIGVWIVPAGDNKTTAKVETSKSLLGIAGQKDWDDEVIAAMRDSLAKQH